MGKGWAKGLTAATDPRVARVAEAHRGKRYVRRTPREDCHWPLAGRTTLPLEWSADMAYVVGLTATDGCLYSRRRRLNFKSSDRELVATYLRLLGRTNRVRDGVTPAGRTVYLTEFHDTRLYGWFQSIGLTPRKSLTIGALDVPDQYFGHFLRGHLDGDGSVLDYAYNGTGKAAGRSYRTLNLRFISGSKVHVAWLCDRIRELYGIAGPLGWSGVHNVNYAKRASLRLLPILYPAIDVPCLERKRHAWETFVRDMAIERLIP